MIEAIDLSDNYEVEFTRFQQETVEAGPSWLTPLRETAFARFRDLGLPTRFDEEWRFTPIAPIVETSFQRAGHGAHGLTAPDLEPFVFPEVAARQLVFVNGRFAPELSSLRSLPAGVYAESLATALRERPELVEPHLGRIAGFDRQAFVALNMAFLEDGVFLSIPRNAVVETPIHVLYVTSTAGTPILTAPRTLLVAGENSQATVVESYAGVGGGVYLTNAVTEVVLGPNAVVDHYKLQRESEQGFHVANMSVLLGRTSNFTSHAIGLGGAIVRNDINAKLDAEGIVCTLNGLYMAKGRQLTDTHTAIDHAMPNCESHELYKGILGGKARGIFNGKIFVRQDAQKTDAKQTNQTLLLSNDAQINTKPQLEIFADDVKCTHGATVGQLSEEALFYLRTRGIGKEDARALLTYAFASDIISRIKIEPIRARLDGILLETLPAQSKEGYQ